MKTQRQVIGISLRLAVAGVLGVAGLGCTTLLGEDFSGYQAQEATAAPAAGDAGADAAAEPDVDPDAQPEAGSGADADAAPAPGTCTDGLQNGQETDTDCGGKACAVCDPGDHCGWAGDCSTGVCTNGVCQAPSCTDFAQNGAETDIDCGGGVCDPCAPNRHCAADGDCDTGFCKAGTCTDPSCSNAAIDPGESDTDCGGGLCAACGDGLKCVADSDCASAVCTEQVCQAPSCTDGVRNGVETDVDCGGASCGTCALGAACALDSDCATAWCQAGVCGQHPCLDGQHNGAETDVDCGGGVCAPCSDGYACLAARDCASAVCMGGVCGVPLCGNGVHDQDESDVDCGGTICRACLANQTCGTPADCLSGMCDSGTCSRTVAVSDPGGTNSYGIDAAEVTQASYAAFLAVMGGSTGGQASYCSWNSSFQPKTSGGGCTGSTYSPASSPDLPVSCVDWCDAAAYCAWAGMRLCGAIGGGSTPYSAFDQATQSQWQNACSAGGALTYPYGDAIDPTACNTLEYGAAAPVAVSEAIGCHGTDAPFSHVRDLSGNVWEWEDSCSKYKNGNDDCRTRGGSFSTAAAQCNRGEIEKRNVARADVGFRCCT